jgi:hypothetical protein
VIAVALPAQAQVRIDVDIRLPGPPALAVIPEVPVYYAPQASANVFFYADQYWVYQAGGWYVGPTWSGPWVVVAPVHVPVPILRVPVRYYRVRPGHWKTWRHDAHPRWEGHFGRDWREDDRERHWHARERHWHQARRHDRDRDHDRGRGPGKHRDDDRHRGPGKGRGR